LESGNVVPADLRLLTQLELRDDESILTREYVPVNKDPAAILPDITPIGDRSNMLHAGSSVSSGSATAIEQVLLSGSMMGIGSFLVFYWLVEVSGWNVFAASNVLLLIMVLLENVHVFNARSERRSAFRIPFTANPLVVGSAFLAKGIHIAAVYITGIREVLDIEPVSP
jgi:magnesium-transporting ATPase (P-type)